MTPGYVGANLAVLTGANGILSDRDTQVVEAEGKQDTLAVTPRSTFLHRLSGLSESSQLASGSIAHFLINHCRKRYLFHCVSRQPTLCSH